MVLTLKWCYIYLILENLANFSFLEMIYNFPYILKKKKIILCRKIFPIVYWWCTSSVTPVTITITVCKNWLTAPIDKHYNYLLVLELTHYKTKGSSLRVFSLATWKYKSFPRITMEEIEFKTVCKPKNFIT